MFSIEMVGIIVHRRRRHSGSNLCQKLPVELGILKQKEGGKTALR